MSTAAQSIGYEAALIEAARARHSRLYGGKEPPVVSRVRSIPVRQPPPKPVVLPMVRITPRVELVEPAAAEPEKLSEQEDVLVPPCMDWKRIVTEVAHKHGVRLTEIIGDQRSQPLVLARHEAFYRLKTETTMSLPAIGRRMRRDHTTVIHGIRKHVARMSEAERTRLLKAASFTRDSRLFIKPRTGGH